MRTFVCAVVALMVLSAPLFAQSQMILDGFEGGTLSAWTASVTSPPGQAAQVYDAGGARIDEVYYDGGWQFKDSGLVATNPGVSTGNYSMGWFRTGPYPNQQYTWVSMILNVTPGEYLMDAAWAAACYFPKTTEYWAIGAKFMVLVGEDVGQYYPGNDALVNPFSVRNTTWNQDSGGNWVSKSIGQRQLITDDGIIEIRLLMHDKFNTDPLVYQYAAFDNVYVNLEAVNLVPEPGSLLALAGGLIGFGGFALRRRK